MKIAYQLGSDKIEVKDGLFMARVPIDLVPALKDACVIEKVQKVEIDIDPGEVDAPLEIVKSGPVVYMKSVRNNDNGILLPNNNLGVATLGSAVKSTPSLVSDINLQTSKINEYMDSDGTFDIYLSRASSSDEDPIDEKCWVKGVSLPMLMEHARRHLNHGQNILNANPRLKTKVAKRPTKGLVESSNMYQTRFSKVSDRLGMRKTGDLGCLSCNTSQLSEYRRLNVLGGWGDAIGNVTGACSSGVSGNVWGFIFGCVLMLLFVVVMSVAMLRSKFKEDRDQIEDDNGGLAPGERDMVDIGANENPLGLAGLVNVKNPFFWIISASAVSLGYVAYQHKIKK